MRYPNWLPEPTWDAYITFCTGALLPGAILGLIATDEGATRNNDAKVTAIVLGVILAVWLPSDLIARFLYREDTKVSEQLMLIPLSILLGCWIIPRVDTTKIYIFLAASAGIIYGILVFGGIATIVYNSPVLRDRREDRRFSPHRPNNSV